jgi:transcriptional repressor NrdR
MQCPRCTSDNLRVIDTTDTRTGVRRRRECLSCGERFTTHERSVAVTPMIVKANGNREEFDREKLKRGIWNACAKRPISAGAVEKVIVNIETYLQGVGRMEIASRVVGDMVINALKDIDPIAYIRYAIVYRGLDNLLSVRAEIDKLLAEKYGVGIEIHPETGEMIVTDLSGVGQYEGQAEMAEGSTAIVIESERSESMVMSDNEETNSERQAEVEQTPFSIAE